MIILLLFIIALALSLFYLILQLDISGLFKFLLVFAEMVAVSQILIRHFKFPSEMGLVLVKSKRGIQAIENLARNERFFEFFSDVGSAISYGLLSLVLFKRKGTVGSTITGLFLLAFLTYLVAPAAFVFLLQILGTQLESKSPLAASAEGSNLLLLGGSAVLLIGGFFLFTLAGIVFYGGVVFSALVKTIFFGTNVIATTSPGGTFLLPGVNLPLFEGVIALSIVMIVHEGAHAVLARLAKVPVLSSGIVIFGIIPVGAFVEPDEKKLLKVERGKQTRVLVAGSTSNFITSCVVFIVFIGLVLGATQLELMQTALAPVLRFIYLTLGLTFALNFMVGMMNLLPLPLFDGYRIIDLNIKNKHLVTALMYGTLFFFVLNFVPWLFKG